MSTTHTITGTGPVQPNGSQQCFTIHQHQFFATAAQITAMGRNPVIGDQLTDNGDGTITLIPNPGYVAPDTPEIDPNDDGAEADDSGTVVV